jgi:predicted transcriptional regulator of viral defense system
MTDASDSARSRALKLAKEFGVVSRRDLKDANLPEEYLARLEDEGELVQLSPGLYMCPDHEPGEHFELAVVAKRVPHAVFFGITALQFHDLTTHVANAVQIAIERGRWDPKIDWPTVDTFHISGEAFTAGVEAHEVEGGVDIHVYSVAKTVADLFKFRNRFGLDVAIEALREGWREQHFTMDELYEYARVCRVHNVIRPYTEMLE